MLSQDSDATAILDGFTIRAGNANGSHFNDWARGGMYNVGQCTPEDDPTGNPTVRNCIFQYNRGIKGAGVANKCAERPVFENCKFQYNKARYGVYGEGGGMHRVLDTRFEDNEAWMNGGAIYENSFSQVRSCLFRLNRAGTEREGKGGGIYATAGNDGEVWIIDSQFEGCDADFGGAVAFNGTRADVVNCGFFGNEAARDVTEPNDGAGGVAGCCVARSLHG